MSFARYPMGMAHLFEPLPIRSLTLANRIVVSPMCEYSSVDGFSNEWHLVHLGSRAVGGAALVLTEATAVTAGGRISPQDLGIYDDQHVPGLARIVRFIHAQQTLAGIQLAHAGRKASTARPWEGGGAIPREQGGWEPVGPTAEPFAPNYPVPCALTLPEIAHVVDAFRVGAHACARRGFDVIEIHARARLPDSRVPVAAGQHADRRVRRIVREPRAPMPRDRRRRARRLAASGCRCSCGSRATDWKAGGWDVDQAVELAVRLRERGVDLVDCSSGGAVHDQQIAVGPGYQVPFAERIRRDAGIATGAVGLITQPAQADAIIRDGQADCVLLARELLRDPVLAAARGATSSASPCRGRRSTSARRTGRRPRADPNHERTKTRKRNRFLRFRNSRFRVLRELRGRRV